MEFETVYQELAAGPTIIGALLSGVTQAQSQIRPAPGSWSILEVICHLLDEEREDFRPRLDIILHRPSDEWPPIDPAGAVTARKYNERDLAESFNQFVAEREKSLAWLRRLAASNWEAEYVTRFGQMKAGDMLTSWAAHDNLHTRQLVELRRARTVKIAEPYNVGYAGEW